jgi:hypothetical protein
MPILSARELLHRHRIAYKETRTGKFTTSCPECGNGYLNVSVNRDGAAWYCHHCEEGGGDKFEQRPEPASASDLGPIKAVYDYLDETGKLLFQALRFEPLNAPKQFRQRAGPDQKKWSVKGIRMIPFRLPEALEAIANGNLIFVVEGEKDVLTLAKHGVIATCNPMGAGKWWPEFNTLLHGADVVLCGDNDAPGRDHIKLVARNLKDHADRIRVLNLKDYWRGIEESDDITDWFEAGHTVEELWSIIDKLGEWHDEPNGTNGAEPPPWMPRENPAIVISLLNEWDAGDDPGFIPPRQWLLGNQFCRGFISSIVAAGGVGKTALRLLQFITLASGMALCGQHVFHRSRVLIISLEDDRDEMQRRIKAVLDFYYKQYGIVRADLKNWLFCASPKMSKLAILRNRERIIGPLEQQVRRAIEFRKPDLISFDPFVKTHSMSENDSGDMDFVCDLLARIASEYNVAIDSPHHVHKGIVTPGDADSGRGSSGIRDAGRLVYTLCNMQEEEAQLFGVEPSHRWSYVRLDPAKINIAVHSAGATWFRLHGQAIGNCTTLYPNGDTIQVVEPWTPPGPWSNMSTLAINDCLSHIAKGTDDGQLYSNAPAVGKERQVWQVVKEHFPDKTEAQCRQIIHAWLDNELLFVDDFMNPVQRKKQKGLFVNDAKRPG